MLLQLDGTLILMAISFLIFMFIMRAIFYAPMSEVRKERDNYINDSRNKARQVKEQAVKLEAEYKNTISEARTNANSIVLKSTAAASKEKLTSLEQKKQETNAKMNSERENILKERESAQEALKQQVSSLAQGISTKILGEEIPVSGISPEVIDKYMNG